MMHNSGGNSPSLYAAIPLHFLAGSSSTYAFTAAQVLLSKGADPNYRNEEGLTPVHVAAAWGNYEILKLFLMNGGDPCLKDEDDKTPLHLANDERHSECARLLKWWLTAAASGDVPRSSSTTTPRSAKKLIDNSKIGLTTPRFFRSPLKRETCDCTVAKSANSDSIVKDRIKRKLFNQSQNESTIVADLSPSKDTTRKLTSELPVPNDLNAELENLKITAKNELSADANTSKNLAISAKFLSSILHNVESFDTSFDQFCTCLSRDLRRGLSPSTASASGDQVDGACLGKRVSDASLDHRSSEDAILNQTALNLAKRLCNAELRSRLQALGDDVGPINDRTRGLYERRLALHLSGELASSQNAVSAKREISFSTELENLLNFLRSPPKNRPPRDSDWFKNLERDDQEMRKFFEVVDNSGDSNVNRKRVWREGILKMSFCYLLLDPEKLESQSITELVEKDDVTINIKNILRPLRSDSAREIWEFFPWSLAKSIVGFPKQDDLKICKEAIQFRRFLQAVFYIGKGKKSRPLQHLVEACRLRDCKNDIKLSSKVRKILSLWESDRGVVSLHVFQNTIPAEAYSREAAMIDAIGIKNLTNVKRGDYYGLTANWTIVKRRKFGSYLLKRAHEILKLERVNPLKCNDILNSG